MRYLKLGRSTRIQQQQELAAAMGRVASSEMEENSAMARALKGKK